MPIDHWMMFGTFAEQRHFVYPTPDTYAGVIINANMVAHAPSGLAGFLLERTVNLPYIIDPMTHAFQHDPKFVSKSDGNTKSSILSLAEKYGAPVSSLVGKRPILPKDFDDKPTFRAFVKNCLDFQSQALVEQMQENSTIKYLLDEDGNVPESLMPKALVAPYFYLTETTLKSWLPIMVRAAEIAKELQGNRQIFGSVVISQGVLAEPAYIDEIVTTLRSVGLSGFLVWVDNLNEQTASARELKGLVSLAAGLRQGGAVDVINLHGGYFSVLSSGLRKEGSFSGITHGPEFGEYRSVVPVGGGIPIARYYVPHLHARIRYQEVLNLFSKKGWFENAQVFHQNVCKCRKCEEVISGDIGNFVLFGESNVREVRRGTGIVRIAYPTADAKQRCLCHYLQRKKIEFQFAATADPAQMIADLDAGIAAFEEVIGLEGVGHLLLWKEILG